MNGSLDFRYIKTILELHRRNESDSAENDREYNLEDIKNKYGRVLNKYTNEKIGDIFINTDLGSKNITTVMFCEEY